MRSVEVVPVPGIPEVGGGQDLGKLILGSLRSSGLDPQKGDIIVVKQKVVSKAEGRVVALSKVVPGKDAAKLALKEGKDPRLVELILKESKRVVRSGHGVIITETKHGFVCANSGVDQSNVGVGFAALLPVDPDGSALKILRTLERGTGKSLAVIITDTFGRPWRRGQTDVAIGCAGMAPTFSYRGRSDKYGYGLRVTEPAIADEVAGAAELVLGKLTDTPVAIVRGVKYVRSNVGARSIAIAPEKDLFR
ncbi:MAG TPA: coenzyme F420-0:L-glutamate ligase [Nitrososphaerales archaeon]|nr:coenzyme F420-0:L-glutamate ligase [Nitrososphaerales archaeon]